MHLFHKWKKLYKTVRSEFLGEEYNDLDYSGIEKCQICGKCRNDYYYGCGCYFHEKLNNNQIKIIKRQIKKGLLVTKD